MKRSFTPIILISTVVLCFCTISSRAQIASISDVRNEIFYAEFDLQKSIQLINDINSLDLTDPIVKAYTGATELLVAKYSWNPISKISFLRKGLGKVNKAVISDSENIEIRFLRFYIQNSLPRYLGLSDDLAIDKKVIIAQLGDLPNLGLTRDIISYINQYMIDSGQCTIQELENIDNAITQLEGS